MTRAFRLLVASLTLSLVAPATVAVPGVAAVDYLDPTFGTGGKVVVELAAVEGSASAIAIQSDGKLVVTGGGPGFTVARFTNSGAPDTTFDGDGVASIGSGSAAAVAIQADGKIVIAGTTDIEGMPGFCCRLGLARLNASGSPDTSFAGDGFLVGDPGVILYGAGVAIQPDTKIVVSGTQNAPPYGGIFVGRYNSNGTIDGTFGSGGYTFTNLGFNGHGGRPALQPDGKILVAGATGTGTTDMLVARYSSTGLPDGTFSGDGLASADFGFDDGAYDVGIQSDGKIVAAGHSEAKFAIARFTASGALDSSFDQDGKVTTDFFGYSYAADLAIQSNDKVVVVGFTYHDYDSSFAIARYDADGWLDAKTTTDFGDPADVGVLCPPARLDCSEDRATGIALQGDGKLVVVGGGGPCGSPCLWTMARYLDLPPIRELTASPATVDLGTTFLGGSPTVGSVTIKNTGSTAANLSATTLVDASNGLSLTGNTCPSTLAAKATCQIDISFAPLETGSIAAELLVASDVPGSPLVVPIAGTAKLPPSGVKWGTRKLAGPGYTWNGGGALGRTVQSGAQRLHLGFATDRIKGSWAKDTGPYVGVYYIRSTSGATWSTPKRLNPSSQHAARLGLTAAGSRVYATWVSQTKWVHYSPTAPRVLYVRVNTNHGASTAWKSTIRLTSTSGRVDYPTIAASGSDVYIAYTDSVTGSIRVAYSRDRGVTWKKISIGSTSISTDSGRLGLPSVAVNGSTVVVAWLSDVAGTVNARVSTDRGATWGTTTTVGSQSTGPVSAAVLGGRIAVAWTTPKEVVVRQRTAGAWQPAKVVAALDPGTPHSPYGVQVALQGSASIAMAWSEEDDGDWVANLRWAESANGGDLWFATQTLATWQTGGNANDWPSILWPAPGTRYIAWNSWTAYSTYYRQMLRVGSGIPVGPTVQGTNWEPSTDAVLPWALSGAETPTTPAGTDMVTRHLLVDG